MKQQLNEIRRMQQLAGILEENYSRQPDVPRFDLDNEIYPLSGNPENLEKLRQILVDGAMSVIKHIADQFGTNTADEFYSLVEKTKEASTLKELGDLYNLMEDFLYENTDVYTSSMGVGKKDIRHPEYGEE